MRLLRRKSERAAFLLTEPGALKTRLDFTLALRLFAAQIFSGMRVRFDAKTATTPPWRCQCGGKLHQIKKSLSLWCRSCGREVTSLRAMMAR